MTAAIVTLASLALVLVLGNPALVLGSSVQDQGCCTGSLICDMYGAFPSSKSKGADGGRVRKRERERGERNESK